MFPACLSHQTVSFGRPGNLTCSPLLLLSLRGPGTSVGLQVRVGEQSGKASWSRWHRAGTFRMKRSQPHIEMQGGHSK